MARQLFNFTGGIRRWGWKYNRGFGDCVEAAINDAITAKATTQFSTWRRVLFYAGFRRPGDRFTFNEYVDFLATQGETPSATTGTSVEPYLDYLKAKGHVTEWARVPLGKDPELAINAAAAQLITAIVTIQLSPTMYHDFYDKTPWAALDLLDSPPVNGLVHEVAYVRATANYDVLATWNQNKLITPGCLSGVALDAHVFLCPADTWRPEYPAMMNYLLALKAS